MPGRRGEGLTLASRPAVLADVPALTELMDAAIAELQRGFLDDEQITASRAIMGIDTQLIEDGTYFVVECRTRSQPACSDSRRRPPCNAWLRSTGPA